MYMLLSLITGIFYFTWTITGISLTAGFAILIIGIPFALLFIGSVRVLSHIEGRIVESLLGVRMPRRLAAAPTDENIWTRIKDALSDIRTWSSMLYLLLMLPLGIVYFVIALVGIVVPVAVIGGSITGCSPAARIFRSATCRGSITSSTRRPAFCSRSRSVFCFCFSRCTSPKASAGCTDASRNFFSCGCKIPPIQPSHERVAASSCGAFFIWRNRFVVYASSRMHLHLD